jgi:hypothetical protein
MVSTTGVVPRDAKAALKPPAVQTLRAILNGTDPNGVWRLYENGSYD